MFDFKSTLFWGVLAGAVAFWHVFFRYVDLKKNRAKVEKMKLAKLLEEKYNKEETEALKKRFL